MILRSKDLPIASEGVSTIRSMEPLDVWSMEYYIGAPTRCGAGVGEIDPDLHEYRPTPNLLS